MILMSMDSYDKELVGNRWLKNHYEVPIGKFWSKIRKSRKNLDFRVEGQNLRFYETLFFLIFLLSLQVLCQHLSKTEPKLFILEHIQLTRKLWFSANMPSQSGHICCMQPPTTMKLCQNVPHMCILKTKKF